MGKNNQKKLVMGNDAVVEGLLLAAGEKRRIVYAGGYSPLFPIGTSVQSRHRTLPIRPYFIIMRMIPGPGMK